ncbi:MAG: PQQ-binding-like beta-propeller repeat protein [Deltaproteobacteria bacterium]|nr:PQQ-binding-like beta-propeller repeat protein [Deltaproteobacteria bacterium]
MRKASRFRSGWLLLAIVGCTGRPVTGPPVPSSALAENGPRGDRPLVELEGLPADPARLPLPEEIWSLDTTQSGERPRLDLVGAVPGLQRVVLVDDHAWSLVALDLGSGEQAWTVALPSGQGAGRGIPVSAILADGVFYGGFGEMDKVAAYDLQDGSKLWETDVVGSPVGSPMVVLGDTLALRTYSRRRESSDADSREPELVVRILSIRDGAELWSAPLAERGFWFAAGSVVGIGAPTGPVDCSDAPEGSSARIEVRRADDGGVLGAFTLDRLLRNPVAAGGVLLTYRGDGPENGRLAAFHLPDLEPLWEGPSRPRPLRTYAWWPVGPYVVVEEDTVLRRVDPATGEETADLDLSPLALATPQMCLVSPSCIDDLAVAGDSYLLGLSVECGPRRLVLLDRATMRPWRVLGGIESPDPGRNQLDAAGSIAVVNTSNRVLAVDLARAGPAPAEALTPAERFERCADRIEAGDLRDWELRVAAAEFALGGASVDDVIVRGMTEGTSAERSFAAAVLRQRCVPDAVPALAVAVAGRYMSREEGDAVSAPPVAVEFAPWGWGDAFEALLGCGDPQGVPALAAMLFSPEAGHSRDLMQGLMAVGTPEARAAIDAWLARYPSREAPWRPSVHEGGTGGRRLDPATLAAGVEVPADRVTWRASADGRVMAVLGDGAGVDTDLWIWGEESGMAELLFTGVPRASTLAILEVSATADGASVRVMRHAGRPSCSTMACSREGREESDPLGEETLQFTWSELRLDRDGDGWSDLLEARMHTDPTRTDTDGDGTDDPLDPAPRGRGPAVLAGCSQDAARTIAFRVAEGNRWSAGPMFVVGPEAVNLEYATAYLDSDPVVWLSPDEWDAFVREAGPDDQFGFFFDDAASESTLAPATAPAEGAVALEVQPAATTPEPDAEGERTIRVTYRYDEVVAANTELTLRCIDAHWYPLPMRETWLDGGGDVWVTPRFPPAWVR